MPRRRLRRGIGFIPETNLFAPVGRTFIVEETILTLDELEALRLKDLEGLDQNEAAKMMGISQPTFHRTLLEARKKVADALVNSKQIKIQGGNYKMVEMQPIGAGRGAGRGAGMGTGRGAGAGGRGRMGGFAAGPSGECICPKCGHRMPHQTGIPCYQQSCPKCGSAMTRG